MLTSQELVRPNEAHVAAKVLDGEAIIINLSNGTYYSMDKVGGLIWEMIDRGQGPVATVAAITARYEVSPEQARTDVQRLAGELIQENLVFVSDKPDSPAWRQKSVAGQRPLYEPPKLNIYRDMSDLLALHPPMPSLEEIPWKESSEEPSRFTPIPRPGLLGFQRLALLVDHVPAYRLDLGRDLTEISRRVEQLLAEVTLP